MLATPAPASVTAHPLALKDDFDIETQYLFLPRISLHVAVRYFTDSYNAINHLRFGDTENSAVNIPQR